MPFVDASDDRLPTNLTAHPVLSARAAAELATRGEQPPFCLEPGTPDHWPDHVRAAGARSSSFGTSR